MQPADPLARPRSPGLAWTSLVAALALLCPRGAGAVSILVLSGTDGSGNSHVTDAELRADFVDADGGAPTITHGTAAPDSSAGYAGYDVVVISEDGAGAGASVIGSDFDSSHVAAMVTFWRSGGHVYLARERADADLADQLYWDITGGSGYWAGGTTAGSSAVISANAGTLFEGTTRAFLETDGTSSDLGNPTLLAPFVRAFDLPGHSPPVGTVVYACEADGSGLLVIDGDRGTPWYSAPREAVDPASGTFGPAVGDVMAGGGAWSQRADCADSDGDRLTNGIEAAAGTDPLDADTDGDGLSDGAEVNELGTDPTLADTDAGGVDDGGEVERGTDPLDGADDVSPEDTGDADSAGGTDRDTDVDLGGDDTGHVTKRRGCGCAAGDGPFSSAGLLAALAAAGHWSRRRSPRPFRRRGGRLGGPAAPTSVPNA